ncbi:MAG: MlaD family protein [Phycisphaeraceae bacterium]
MNDRKRNFFVGLTALAGVVGFVYLVFIFGEVPTWVTDTYRITITMNNAGGITPGSRVRLNGVDVGHVENVQLQSDPTEGVLIHTEIQSGYEILSDARVSSSAGLIGGAAQLAIVATKPPGVAVAPPLPKDGTGKLHGEAPTDFGTLTQQLEHSVQEQLANFGKLTEKLTELSDQYIVVGQRAGEMLEHRDLADVDAGRVQANLTTMLARSDATLSELHQTIDQMNQLVGDKELHQEIRQTITNTRLFTEDARRVAANADENLDKLTRRYVAVADDLSKTLLEVDDLVQEAREGQGTLGLMINDPSLYNNLQDAAGRLSDALREGQLLLEKWRAEGVPVQF